MDIGGRRVRSAFSTLWKTVVVATTTAVIFSSFTQGMAAERPLETTTFSLAPGKNSTYAPKGIIIMAQGRSGSTMLGEFFRQNEGVLYLYEPCRGVRRASKFGLECLELLNRIVSCDFTVEDTTWFKHDMGAVRRGSRQLLTSMNVYPVEDAHASLMVKCKRSRAVVVKTIRLPEGLGVGDGIVPGALVLHLVRDPRAVARSERTNFNIVGAATSNADELTKTREVGRSVCSIYREQLDSSAALDSTRYLRVRYEDLATLPALAAKLIYCWSGLQAVPPTVLDWIDANTKLPACTAGRHRTLKFVTETSSGHHLEAHSPEQIGYEGNFRGEYRVLTGAMNVDAEELIRPPLEGKGQGGGTKSEVADCNNNQKEEDSSPYETKRQSSAMVDMWRTKMPKTQANAVWEACEDSGVMTALGYDL